MVLQKNVKLYLKHVKHFMYNMNCLFTFFSDSGPMVHSVSGTGYLLVTLVLTAILTVNREGLVPLIEVL